VRLLLLVTSPRVPPGLLSADAWAAVRSGPVFTRDQDHPQRGALAAAGVATEALDPDHPPHAIARILRDAAQPTGSAVWLAGPGGDDDIGRALAEMAARAVDLGDEIEIEVVTGSWDAAGARLLDVVATMDRLRSPGGCPWDAKQTHESLAPYLLEEAYEAFEAIEDGDAPALREELGDVLLQVAFHARLAAELPPDERWTIDDVAAGLVEKLVRRHPHVFADVDVTGADEVVANWDVIKAEEKAGRGPLDGVPLAMAALTLAQTLQRKAGKAGLAVEVDDVETALAAYGSDPGATTAGELLWALAARLRHDGVDAEAALRARARAFRDSTGAASGTGTQEVGGASRR
jgi:XTP/dITP diphosphohydrolase